MPDATPAICGTRHESYPETICTEPPAHRMPHGGPLIIGGRECGGAAWGTDDGYADTTPAPVPDLALAQRYTWAESVASTGTGDSASIEIDVHAPGDDEPVPVEVPLADARVLHAMLGGVLAEHGTPEPLHKRAAQALHAQLPGCTHDEHGADCAALADVVAAALAPELAELADYRNRITWETTCGEHGRLLDACRAADERAEQAEARLRSEFARQERYEDQIVGQFNQQAINLARRAELAEAALERMRRLHARSDARRPLDWSLTPIPHCTGCDQDWPCPTVRALTPTADTPKEPTT